MKITILGSGASHGVPSIGCECPVCLSTNSKNKRLRVSLLIESATTRILVDTSPDLRAQALRHKFKTVDAIIFTHPHADHLHGIDDVRSFNYHRNGPIPIYGTSRMLEDIRTRFSYTLLPPNPADDGWYRASLVPHEIHYGQTFTIGDVEILALEQDHGKGKSLGLRIGKFGYSIDTNHISEATLKAFEGVETWIVDCLRKEPAPSHAHLALALNWIARIKPKRAFLTHMNHTLDHETLERELPKGVEPAYDGLVIEV